MASGATMLDRRVYWTEGYLDKKLQQARSKLERERAEKKRAAGGGLPLGAKVLKYGVMLWAARLGILGLGSLVPLLGTFVSMLHPAARSGLVDVPTFTVAELVASVGGGGGGGGPALVRRAVRHQAAAARRGWETPILVRNLSNPIPRDVLVDALVGDFEYKSIKVESSKQARHRSEDDRRASSTFTYFDRSAAWADRLDRASWSYKVTASLEDVRGFPFGPQNGDVGGDDDEFSCKSGAGKYHCRRFGHDDSRDADLAWHITQPLVRADVGKLAPDLLALVEDQEQEGGVEGPSSAAAYRLWLGRENVTVAPHYDVEDNWFHQLHGAKTFLLASAEAFRFYRPRSVLHPHWRQAQRSYLNTVRALELAVHEVRVGQDYEEESPPRSTSPAPAPEKKAALGWSAPAVRIWQVTLHPGDVLFVPAYTFHMVTTGPRSVSVNAWLPSAPSQLYQDLKRLVPLAQQQQPSSSSSQLPTPAVQLAQLGTALGVVLSDPFVRGRYTTAYVRKLWENRHRKEASPGLAKRWCPAEPTTTAAAGLCSSLNAKELRLQSLLISQTIIAVLKSASSASPPAEESPVVDQSAIRLLVVLDWAEESLHEILSATGTPSSPCVALRFIDTCVGW